MTISTINVVETDLRYLSSGIQFTNYNEQHINLYQLPHGIYQFSMKQHDTNRYFFAVFAINGTQNFHTVQSSNINYTIDLRFSATVNPHIQIKSTGTHYFSIIKLV